MLEGLDDPLPDVLSAGPFDVCVQKFDDVRSGCAFVHDLLDDKAPGCPPDPPFVQDLVQPVDKTLVFRGPCPIVAPGQLDGSLEIPGEATFGMVDGTDDIGYFNGNRSGPPAGGPNGYRSPHILSA